MLLYDRLANSELLNYSRPGCDLIYVSKQKDQHILPQNRFVLLATLSVVVKMWCVLKAETVLSLAVVERRLRI